jgi:predicted transglutaminase-like cysteine proteinase
MRRQILWTNPLGALAVAVLLLGAAAQTDFGEPFALATVDAPEGPLWADWQRWHVELQSDELIIGNCRHEPESCGSPAALQLLAIIDEALRHEGLALIGHVNRAVNLAIKPTSPSAEREKWKSPLAALAAETGNCTSYAIIKYAALRDAGIAADDLRLVIVRIGSLQQDHMVVGVRNEGNWLILDDRSMALAESSELHDYDPLYLLDDRGVREFVLPANPKVAVAACTKTFG